MTTAIDSERMVALRFQSKFVNQRTFRAGPQRGELVVPNTTDTAVSDNIVTQSCSTALNLRNHAINFGKQLICRLKTVGFVLNDALLKDGPDESDIWCIGKQLFDIKLRPVKVPELKYLPECRTAFANFG